MTNYYSGFIVGITQTAIGHPLDTMKVIYQNNPNADSKLMNIRNLYRGWKFPLLASTTFNGSIFNMHDYFKSKNIRLGNNDNGFLAGSLQVGLGFILITIGARKTLSAMVGIIMLTEAILGPLWAWLFVNENPSFYVLIGGSIIILAVFLQFVSSFTKENKYNPQ